MPKAPRAERERSACILSKARQPDLRSTAPAAPRDSELFRANDLMTRLHARGVSHLRYAGSGSSGGCSQSDVVADSGARIRGVGFVGGSVTLVDGS